MHFVIIGTDAVENTNLIKECCLQVTLGALYLKLADAKTPSCVQKDTRGMCFYWYLILKLEIEILFFGSIPESNFMLYILNLKKMVKSIFALDHYHYARWLSMDLSDLMTWY